MEDVLDALRSHPTITKVELWRDGAQGLDLQQLRARSVSVQALERRTAGSPSSRVLHHNAGVAKQQRLSIIRSVHRMYSSPPGGSLQSWPGRHAARYTDA